VVTWKTASLENVQANSPPATNSKSRGYTAYQIPHNGLGAGSVRAPAAGCPMSEHPDAALASDAMKMASTVRGAVGSGP
jgi:hypothetical protein